jgi:hypothetical protein
MEFKRILKPSGALFIVLPYPDIGDIGAHSAKNDIGTTVEDDGHSVMKYFCDRGFILIENKIDVYREPEIWLILKKI